MDQLNIFVSVGGTATPEQEAFVCAVEARLRAEGMNPCTVGRNQFSVDAPLKKVNDLMRSCSGAVILALERTWFQEGVEKRGGPQARRLSETKLPTSWNQIEAAMAYMRGLPLMVIVEHDVKQEGLLERGHDWHVQKVLLDESALATPEFNGVLADWKQKILSKSKAKGTRRTRT